MARKKIEIGDIMNLPMNLGLEKKEIKLCKVIYIHPKQRYFTVEFQTKLGPVRESFCMNGDM